MTGDDPDGVYECSCGEDGAKYHGFALKVAVPDKAALLDCITPVLFDKGCLLANKALKMYMALGRRTLATIGTQELYNNLPFPAWRSALPLVPKGLKKDGLDEVWNYTWSSHGLETTRSSL